MRQNPDFVAREVGDEIVLVPVTHAAAELENLYTFNPVGGRIWDLVATCSSEAEIAAELTEEFEVEEAEALADVAEFLGQLRDIGAVLDD